MPTATTASIFNSSARISSPSPSPSPSSSPSNSTPITNACATSFLDSLLREFPQTKRNPIKTKGRMRAAAVGATPPAEEIKEFVLPSWAQFDLGRAPVYWKTMNGRPPSSGERLKLFYNPAATKLTPNDDFGIAFNGGFNQPIMCGGEPRAMLRKDRGKLDPPIYTIQICIPKHAVNLIFSFTNGTDWDGPYRLMFQVPKAWRNKQIDFFNEGLAQELSQEGACDRAIFPDTNIVIDRCAMIGNLTLEGGDRCDLNLVSGCTDPSSSEYNPFANVDDGSCPPYSDSED